MIEFEEYKVKLNNLKPQLETLKDGMKLAAAREEIRELEARTAADGFGTTPPRPPRSSSK